MSRTQAPLQCGLFETPPPPPQAKPAKPANDLDPFAIFSDDGRYRYLLGRPLGGERGRLLAAGLINGSTATAKKNDPTVTRLENFGSAWGFGGLLLFNLLGYVTPHVVDLRTADDPVGADNDEATLAAILGQDRLLRLTRRFGVNIGPAWVKARVDLLLCGWGPPAKVGRKLAPVVAGRARWVLLTARSHGIVPHALRFTKCGAPIHPLYQPADLRPVPIPESA